MRKREVEGRRGREGEREKQRDKDVEGEREKQRERNVELERETKGEVESLERERHRKLWRQNMLTAVKRCQISEGQSVH